MKKSVLPRKHAPSQPEKTPPACRGVPNIESSHHLQEKILGTENICRPRIETTTVEKYSNSTILTPVTETFVRKCQSGGQEAWKHLK